MSNLLDYIFFLAVGYGVGHFASLPQIWAALKTVYGWFTKPTGSLSLEQRVAALEAVLHPTPPPPPAAPPAA